MTVSVNDFMALSLREDVLDKAANAWAEYLETGLHLTGQEARNGLESWGTAPEMDLPAPHA